MAGGNKVGINTLVGGMKMASGDLTSGVAGTLMYVLTVRMAAVDITDMDIINVGVSLEREDEANQVCSGQQHRDGVHQRPGGHFLHSSELVNH